METWLKLKANEADQKSKQAAEGKKASVAAL
jgi:hypothetical protein